MTDAAGKPVDKDHLRDHITVVFVDRWFTHRGVWFTVGWLMYQITVVSVDRWFTHRGV
jgi:hypothetical protein